MKIYFGEQKSEINKESLNPLLVELFKDGQTKVEKFSIKPIKSVYTISESIEESDLCVLPFLWNYYIDNNQINLAIDLYNQATSGNKKLLIFSSGDFTANLPFNNSIVIQSSCFKSRDQVNGNKLLAIPTFISDYCELYTKGNIQVREKSKIPRVGFCGQANGTLLDYTRRFVNLYLKKLKNKIKILKWEPPSIEPTYFRHKILQRINVDKRIESNFILRTRYRAGYQPKVKDPFHPTRIEFINNILDSDYTVCLRGGGNFSVRFYETLSLGRIPIFINTDCILPLDELVDYKKYTIWVEPDEIPYIAEKILDFHKSITNDTFREIQVECRHLWEKYLTRSGFFSHLPYALSK